MTTTVACPAASSTLMHTVIVLETALPAVTLAWTAWHAVLFRVTADQPAVVMQQLDSYLTRQCRAHLPASILLTSQAALQMAAASSQPLGASWCARGTHAARLAARRCCSR